MKIILFVCAFLAFSSSNAQCHNLFNDLEQFNIRGAGIKSLTLTQYPAGVNADGKYILTDTLNAYREIMLFNEIGVMTHQVTGNYRDDDFLVDHMYELKVFDKDKPSYGVYFDKDSKVTCTIKVRQTDGCSYETLYYDTDNKLYSKRVFFKDNKGRLQQEHVYNYNKQVRFGMVIYKYSNEGDVTSIETHMTDEHFKSVSHVATETFTILKKNDAGNPVLVLVTDSTEIGNPQVRAYLYK